MSAHRPSRPSGTRSQPVKATQPFTLQTSAGSSGNATSTPSLATASTSSVGVVAGSSAGGSAVGGGTWQPSQRRSPGSPGGKGRRLRRHGSPGTSPAPQQRTGTRDMPMSSANRFSPSPSSCPSGSKADDGEQRFSSVSHQRPGSVEFEICEKHGQLERQGSGSHPASPLSRFHCRRVSMDSAELTSEIEDLSKAVDEMHVSLDYDGRRIPVAELLSQRSLSSCSPQTSDGDRHSSAGVASPVVIQLLSGSPCSMYFGRVPPEDSDVVRLLPTEPQTLSLGGHPQGLGPDRSKVNMTFSSQGTAFRQFVPGMNEVIARQPSPVVVGNGAG